MWLPTGLPTPVSLLPHPGKMLIVDQKPKSKGCPGDTAEVPNKNAGATLAGQLAEWTEGWSHLCLESSEGPGMFF